MSRASEWTPRGRERANAARLAGALYLVTMTTSIVDEMLVKGPMVVAGDASATAANIASHEQWFRVGLAASTLTSLGVSVLIWALFVLLKDVRRDLVILAAALRWIENAVGFVAILFSLSAVLWLGQATYLAAFEPQQLHVLSRMLLRMQGQSLAVAFLLLGSGSAVFAYVFRESGYIPRRLAEFGMAASGLLAASSFAGIVYPAIGPYQMALMLPMGVYEVTLGLALLVRASAIGGLADGLERDAARRGSSNPATKAETPS